VGNVAIESIVGAIPVLGDIFDIAWKANVKNFALLRAHSAVRPLKERSSRQIMSLLVWAIILMVIGVGAVSVIIVRFLYQLITN
jgi:Domain of unknown function (DUF4112)